MDKKIMVLLLLGIFLVLTLAAGVSAKTLIAGTIYNSDYSVKVGGADVVVNCNGNIVETISNETDGTYSVEYCESKCNWEDELTVSASHPSYGYGSQTGIIHKDAFGSWDLAIVNVPLAPEFGLIAGMVTILGAFGLFFYVRKK